MRRFKGKVKMRVVVNDDIFFYILYFFAIWVYGYKGRSRGIVLRA
jgi:hypothetical protein